MEGRECCSEEGGCILEMGPSCALVVGAELVNVPREKTGQQRGEFLREGEPRGRNNN